MLPKDAVWRCCLSCCTCGCRRWTAGLLLAPRRRLKTAGAAALAARRARAARTAILWAAPALAAAVPSRTASRWQRRQDGDGGVGCNAAGNPPGRPVVGLPPPPLRPQRVGHSGGSQTGCRPPPVASARNSGARSSPVPAARRARHPPALVRRRRRAGTGTQVNRRAAASLADRPRWAECATGLESEGQGWARRRAAACRRWRRRETKWAGRRQGRSPLPAA